MRTDKLLLFSCLLIFVIFNSKVISQSLFQKNYGNVNEDYGRGICQTADTGFYISGGTNSFTESTNLYLFNIDKNGNLIWSNNIGGDNIDWGISVIETQDGGAAVLGYTNSFGAGGYDFYLIKSDSQGNILWQKTYGGADWDFGYSIAEDNLGNLYLAGETYSYGSGNNDGYIIKTNNNGEIIWEKTIGTGLFEKISKIILLNNDNVAYAATQEADSQGSSGEFVVGTIDPLGNEIWQIIYSNDSDDEIADIIESGDNNLVFTGTMNPGIIGQSDTYFQKISLLNGDYILSNSIGLSNSDDIAKCVIELSNNDLLISTTSYPGTFGNGDFVNTRLNQEGFLVPGYTSMGYLGTDILYSICKTAENGYAVTGQSDSFGDLNNQVLVCIVDSNNQNIDYTGVIDIIDNFSINVTPLEYSNKPNTKIYPNPFSSSIQINGGENIIDQLVIKDPLGNIILKEDFENGNEIDLSILSDGFYFIELNNNEKIVSRTKIVKNSN